MKRLSSSSTKKGAASLYVVIFTTILFGVIVLSFIRIILSESTQSSNDDLSRSAYDSALAGVEDAKIVVNKYYQCLSNPSDPTCASYATSSNVFGGDCESFNIKQLLYPGSTDAEVKIQESMSGSGAYVNNTDQAYTCVIVSNIVPDYRSTLSSDTRTRVVPLGVASGKLGSVKSVSFRWYSNVNGTTNFSPLTAGSSTLPTAAGAPTPPVISLTLLRTDSTIKVENTAEDANYSTMILLPVSGGGTGTNSISSGEIDAAGLASSVNHPFDINCTNGEEFACSVTLETSFAAGGNAFLIVSLPYGDTITDFAVTLFDGSGSSVDFENVQVSVDSTGRANQLLRRVETRLDPSDTFFPYPEYEITLGNGGTLSKNFWITYNCWTEAGACDNNGNL